MVSSKSEQVGQLALNSAAAGQFTLSMNVQGVLVVKKDRQMDSQNDRQNDELTDREMGYLSALC